MAVATDKIGLVATPMMESFPVADPNDAVAALADGAPCYSVAGLRCSQGGQTLAKDGRMLTTELFSRPIQVFPGDYDPANPRQALGHPPTVTVAAGTLWSHLHHELNLHGLAPAVHQSSCHFSVGGSVSVNCHGRDPGEGPIGNIVNWLDVLRVDNGKVERISRAHNTDLFRAVVGGYGSCAIILQANLQVKPNLLLEQVGWVADVNDYARHLGLILEKHPSTRDTSLHYGWLRCTDPQDLYDEVLIVDYKDTGMPQAAVREHLEDEAWGTMELMRAGWAAIRHGNAGIKREMWRLVKDQIAGTGTVRSRLNWMRAAIAFTAYRGKADQDILQEFFVPLADFPAMVQRLRTIFADHRDHVRILSTTVRLVRADDLPANLSYCAAGPRVAIAVDMNVNVDHDGDERRPTAAVDQCIRDCIAAIPAGGTYYLPYYPFATDAEFRKFYDTQRQLQAIGQFNPQRKLQNVFMQSYLQP